MEISPEAKTTGPSDKPWFVDLSRPIAAASVWLSALQGVFFALDGPVEGYKAGAVVLAVATVLFAWKVLLKPNVRLFLLVAVLLLAQLGVYSAILCATLPPFPFRLLQVGIVTTYLAIIFATLLSAAKVAAPPKAFLASFSTAISLFCAEALQDWPRFSPQSAQTGSGQVEWSVRWRNHPVLGPNYAPHSVIKTHYPDNPRGYFRMEELLESQWRLFVHEDSEADLSFSQQDPPAPRIAIRKVGSDIPWHVQLNHYGPAIKAKEFYSLTFEARAERPRKIGVAVSQPYAPWENLGLYKDIEVTPEWRKFELQFDARKDENTTRAYFDVGGSQASVELSGITLRRNSTGETLNPSLKKKYVVKYRVNELGCRGPDYAIPRPADIFRILILGDSFAMGVGVHEEDTLSHQLERLLNGELNGARPGRSYEVINCGQSGFSTRDERLFYEIFGARYEPDLVLLAMVWNDDLSWRDEQHMPHVTRQPSRLEAFSLTLGNLQRYRYQRPYPDYSAASQELLRLYSQVKNRGGRLAVVFFRDVPRSADQTRPGRYWSQLVATVQLAVRGTDIALLDIRDALYARHSWEELWVHKIADPHPNEIAHAIAAREIMNFLPGRDLLSPRVSSRVLE